MNKIVNKGQAIRTTVWIVVLCMLFSLWPLRLIKETVVSGSRGQVTAQSEPVTEDYTVQQMFIAQYDRLKNIDIYFTEGTADGEFEFVLYDAKMNMLMQQPIKVETKESFPGFCTVQVNIDAEVGREYYYLVRGMGDPFRLAYENTEDSGNIYIGTLYYGNVEDTERCAVTRFEYSIPLRKGKTLLCAAALLLIGISTELLTRRYYAARPQKDTLVTVEQTVKAVCDPLIVMAAAAAFLAVWPCRLFTTDTVSIIFYEVSVAAAAAILLYAVNHDRTGIASDRTVLDVLGAHWRSLLQSVCFAGALWACCNYMNGLYEMHHTAAFRQELIFLALAVIVTYKGRDLFNIVDLIYAAAALGYGTWYYRNTVMALEEPDEEQIRIIRLTVWACALAGLVIIGTIRYLVRRQIKGISVWYWIPVVVFFALILWHRNTRGWPVYLVCAFGVFYLNMAAWDGKAELLKNICNGILLHFGVMTLYCLLHRPYMFFIYSRYPFIFHTVTMTGVYLALVVCAALVRFWDAYRKCPRLAGVYRELLILGVSSVYLVLTLSRTGYIAVLAMALVIVPVMCVSMKRRRRDALRGVAWMALAVLLCFPVTFTAQRIIPSVAASPILHEIEELPDEIMHGRYMDSRYYMTPKRFIQVFQMKILGVPEDRVIGAREILLASAADGSAGIPADSDLEKADREESYTNGRLEIFRLYIDNLNTDGHDKMGIQEENGEYIFHAHNIYLQVAYDHGIYVGAAFILLGLCTLVQAALYYHAHKDDRVCAVLPLALLTVFAVAGLTEWIFHPCNPMTFCLMAAMASLLFDRQRTIRHEG